MVYVLIGLHEMVELNEMPCVIVCVGRESTADPKYRHDRTDALALKPGLLLYQQKHSRAATIA